MKKNKQMESVIDINDRNELLRQNRKSVTLLNQEKLYFTWRNRLSMDMRQLNDKRQELGVVCSLQLTRTCIYRNCACMRQSKQNNENKDIGKCTKQNSIIIL